MKKNFFILIITSRKHVGIEGVKKPILQIKDTNLKEREYERKHCYFHPIKLTRYFQTNVKTRFAMHKLDEKK